MTGRLPATLLLLAFAAAVPGTVHAQSLGTFRWQLQPYCNIITVQVTQIGSVYRLEGTDDRCGAGADQNSVIGTAFQNPDGSIGFGLNIVSTPGGLAVPVDADIALSTLSGTWRDGGGRSGSFVLTPGAGTGGSPRPATSPSSIPTSIGLLSDGGLVARGTFGVGVIPAQNIGTRMMWYPGKSAFRAGTVNGPLWDDVNVGVYSTAIGFDVAATAAYSTAFGALTSATGPVSTAMGQETQATSAYSTSMGAGTIASGIASTAMGGGTRAQGQRSTSMGNGTFAIGTNSVAMGSGTSATGAAAVSMGDATNAGGPNSLVAGSASQANGAESVAIGLRVFSGGNGSVVLGSDAVAQAAAAGTFIFSDRSTTSDFVGFAPNEFLVRAAGGVGLYTNAGLTAGVTLTPGDSSWNSLSDVNMKEEFRELSGEDVLGKLSRMPVMEWSYKAQGSAVRHVGPTAQDFRAAFGLGADPLRISSVDADGIALAAVRALETRTRGLMESNRMLADENRQLHEAADELRARLERLERLIKKR